MVIDSGSSDFLIPNAGCNSCAGNATAFYNKSMSTTADVVHCDDTHKRTVCVTCTINQCGFSVGYVGLTEHALVVADVVALAQVGGPRVTTFFGAIDNITMVNSFDFAIFSFS